MGIEANLKVLFAAKVFHRLVKPEFRGGRRSGHSCAFDPYLERSDRADKDEQVRPQVNDHQTLDGWCSEFAMKLERVRVIAGLPTAAPPCFLSLTRT